MSALLAAIEANDVTELRRLLTLDSSAVNELVGEGFDNRTLLARAAELGSVELCTVLLDHGADVLKSDVNGGTALWFASERGHTAVAALLKQRGAGGAVADDDDGADYDNAGLNFDD
jgi:ankyrin repeat protein